MIGSSRRSLAGFILVWIFTGCGEGAAGPPEQIAEDAPDTEMPSASSQATSPVITPGPTAFGNETFVGVLGGWQTWYEKQEFYRSENGIDCEIIGAGSFGAEGHSIRDIAFGRVPAGLGSRSQSNKRQAIPLLHRNRSTSRH